MKETEDSKGEVFSGYLVREPARQKSCRRHRNGLDIIFLIVKLSAFINLLKYSRIPPSSAGGMNGLTLSPGRQPGRASGPAAAAGHFTKK